MWQEAESELATLQKLNEALDRRLTKLYSIQSEVRLTYSEESGNPAFVEVKQSD